MRRVIQRDITGCGLACIAMLSGKSYSEVRKKAMDKLGFEDHGVFYTNTSQLVSLGREFSLNLGKRRRKFKGYDALPNIAILAINYREKSDTWHWVIYHKSSTKEYVLDPKKSIKNNKRTDLSRIAKNATHWLPIEYV